MGIVSTWTVVLIFGGAPAAIFGIIVAAVTLTSGAKHPYDPFVIVGLVREETGCVPTTDGAGREVHEPQPGSAPTCFTARCAECRTVHRHGAHDVHFRRRQECVDHLTARGWRLAGPRLRCPRCR